MEVIQRRAATESSDRERAAVTMAIVMITQLKKTGSLTGLFL